MPAAPCSWTEVEESPREDSNLVLRLLDCAERIVQPAACELAAAAEKLRQVVLLTGS